MIKIVCYGIYDYLFFYWFFIERLVGGNGWVFFGMVGINKILYFCNVLLYVEDSFLVRFCDLL